MATTPVGKPDMLETRLFINGEFVNSLAGKTFDVINPATEELAVTVQEALPEDVDFAVAAAKGAFPAWAALDASKRAEYILKIADILEVRMDEIGYCDAICMGTPYQAPPFKCKTHLFPVSSSLLTK